MHYYKKVKDGKILAYLSQSNEIEGGDLISIDEEEYNKFIKSVTPDKDAFLEMIRETRPKSVNGIKSGMEKDRRIKTPEERIEELQRELKSAGH